MSDSVGGGIDSTESEGEAALPIAKPSFDAIEDALSTLLEALEAQPDADLEALLLALSENLRSPVREGLDALQNSGLLPGEQTFHPGRTLLKRFEVRSLVGQGGMGRVYSAWDRQLGRQVAIKVMRRFEIGSPRNERFLNEAHVTAGLEHPAILGIHELLELPSGEPLLVMPFVAGQTLQEAMQSQALGWSIRRRVEVVRRVAEAAAYAHEQGVLHRDLKPSNVMIGSHGEVLLMDWGLARMSGEDQKLSSLGNRGSAPDEASISTGSGQRAPSLSQTGDLLGTPGFMAPEQERADGSPMDERTDVYGVGALLKQVLSAQGELPAELAAVCARCLAPDPSSRYQDLAGFLADIEAYLDDRQGDAWRDSFFVRIAKTVRRHPALTSLSAASVLIALLLASLVQLRDELNRERSDLQVQRETLAANRQAAADQLSVKELRGLQEGWIGPQSQGDARQRALAASHALVRGLARHGLDLESQSSDALLRVLRETHARNTVLAEQMELALHELAFHIINARLPMVPGARTVPQTNDEPAGFQASSEDPWLLWVAEKDPWAVAAWNSLLPTLDQLDLDPWRQDLWRRLKELWLKRVPDIDPMDVAVAEQTRSGRDILLAARAWLSELRRLHGRSESQAYRQVRSLQRLATVNDPSSYRPQYTMALLDNDARSRSPLPLVDDVLALAHATAAHALRPESYQALHQRALSLGELASSFRSLAGNLNDKKLSDAARKSADQLVQQSAEVYQLCLTREPEDAGTLCNFASLLTPVDSNSARLVFARAYELQPQNREVLRRYSEFLARLPGSADESLVEELWRAWLSVEPANWIPYKKLLRHLIERDRLQEAQLFVNARVSALTSLPPSTAGIALEVEPISKALHSFIALVNESPRPPTESLLAALER